MRNANKLVRVIFGGIIALLIGIGTFQTVSYAADVQWTSTADPTLAQETRAVPLSPYPNIYGCASQKITVDGTSLPFDACATTGATVKIAVYNDNGNYRLAMSYRSESKFYTISNVSYRDYYLEPVLIPGTDILYVERYLNSQQRSLSVFKDITTKLSKNTQIFGHTEYNWNVDTPDFELKDENNDKLGVNAKTHSSNGRWIVVEVMGRGLARIDTSNLTAEVISRYAGAYNQGNNPVMNIALTDDGEHVAVGGQNAGLYLFDTPASCGDPVANAVFSSGNDMPHPCAKKEYLSFVESKVNRDNLTWPTNLEFNYDGGELSFYYGNANTASRPYVTLRAPGYISPAQLDYLALGDSYSSGEGDTAVNLETGKKYYRAWTDNEESQSANQPREKCHLSTRSYPYLLALNMNLGSVRTSTSNGNWQSIACSGAKIDDMLLGNLAYQGQDERLKKYDNLSLQSQALNEFIPGRKQQVAFVKKYKPKVITLTMGGNNANFGSVITTCVNPEPFFTGGEWAKTCSYATDNDKKVYLYNQIKKQYDKLRELYKELYDASGRQAKIYVLGYPQIVNADAEDAACGLNVRLNKAERQMVREGYAYMNDVIEAAAKSIGVKYVDIEDSLAGHRLCDSDEKYVTGLAVQGNNEIQESFHPNAHGHEKMASTFIDKLGGQSPLTYQICPDTSVTLCPDNLATQPLAPPYFANAEQELANRNIFSEILTTIGDTVQKLTSFNIITPEFYFNPNSPLSILLYSDPTDLDTVTASNTGQLNTSVTIPPAVPAGYHTLVIKGESYSGEDVEVWQIVKVLGSNPSDRDENDVPDSQQACGLFFEASNQDKDQDGIDDACDPEIGPPPAPKDPYRLRAGDTTKTYAGTTEQSNALYLERNIYTAAKTGVSGDYDPDHDGWVVIATNQSASGSSNVPMVPPATPYARFWWDGVDGSILPHVSFRTSDNGCVQYKPADLSKVTATNSTQRLFTKEAQDTNTCRTEAPTADADNNGMPDNTQPLYRARIGNPAIRHTKSDGTTFTEDPTKLYLERSTRGAEAQLDKSDYALNTAPPIGPMDATDHREAWSLLATSPANAFLFPNNFTKLKFIHNYPYVLTGYTSTYFTNCSAYKPENIGTIGRTTQITRQLHNDWMTSLSLTLQGGC
jgi:lysophospholipase L1-like esterase